MTVVLCQTEHALYTLFEEILLPSNLTPDRPYTSVYDVLDAYLTRFGSHVSTMALGHLKLVKDNIFLCKKLVVLFPVLVQPLLSEVYGFSRRAIASEGVHSLRALRTHFELLSGCCLRDMSDEEVLGLESGKTDFLGRPVSVTFVHAHLKCGEPEAGTAVPKACALTLPEINRKVGVQGLKVKDRTLPPFTGGVCDAVQRAGLFLRREVLQHMQEWSECLLDTELGIPFTPTATESPCAVVKRAWQRSQNKNVSSALLRANGVAMMGHNGSLVEPRPELYSAGISRELEVLVDEMESGRDRNARVGYARLLELEEKVSVSERTLRQANGKNCSSATSPSSLDTAP